MPKIEAADIDEADLTEFLKTQDNFALELRLQRYAKSLGLSTAHGGSYIDPTTGKHRQFDLRATKTRNDCAIAFAVECKCLQKNFPLLVSCIPRSDKESYQTVALLEVMPSMVMPKAIRRVTSGTIYPMSEAVGKSMAQVGKLPNGAGWTSGDSDAYEKWSQALQSSVELFVAALRHTSKVTKTAVIPSLVVSDDTLWAVEYASDGSQTSAPKKVDEITFFVDRKFPVDVTYVREVSVSHLHIFTERGFKKRLDNIHDHEDWWGASFSNL